MTVNLNANDNTFEAKSDNVIPFPVKAKEVPAPMATGVFALAA